MDAEENIKLEYSVIIKHGDDAYFAKGCEVFVDEHKVQWVKFFPRNGYYRGREHMVQTHDVMIIRDDREDTSQT